MKKLIFISFSLIFLLVSLGSGLTLYNLSRTSVSLRELIGLHQIEAIRQDLNLSVQKVRAYVHLSGLDFSYNLNEIIANTEKVETRVQDCHKCHHKPEITRELNHLGTLVTEFQEKLSYLITTVEDSPWRRENQRLSIQGADTIDNLVQEMVRRAAVNLRHKSDVAMGNIDHSYRILLVTIIATLLLGLLTAKRLTRLLTQPIDRLLTATRQITNGELGYQAEATAPREFAELLAHFNEMSSSLAKKEKENTTLYRDLENRIAELRTTQHKLIESGKLAALGKLAGGIAHDFNNLLCGITANIALLRHNCRDEQTFRLLETIDKASFRAAKLTQQLLIFARQTDWQEEPLDLNQVIIATSAKSLAATAGAANTVKLLLAPDLHKVTGDPARFEELLLILLNNASQAIDNQGEIEVSTCNQLLDARGPELNLAIPNGSYVKIRIKDNGKGIAASALPNVFNPYFTTQAMGEQKGAGLGLAIAYSIVKKHQGHIAIDSSEGVGTEVVIYLPALSEGTRPPALP